MAQIQTVGELFSGDREVVANASGFLVTDDLVVTNDHAVPANDGRYKAQTVGVRLGSNQADGRAGTVIARDSARDLALVQIAPVPAPRPYCPMSALADDALAPSGLKLIVLSYPLDEDLSVNDGVIRNHGTPLQWRISVLLNYGDSGAPVFSEKGYVIGVAVGGVVGWTDLDGHRSPVFGLNYIIPIANLGQSPLGAEIARHPGADCWQTLTSPAVTLASLTNRWSATVAMTLGDAANNTVGPEGATSGGTAGEASVSTGGPPSGGVVQIGQEPPPPPSITRTVTVETMKDDHGISATTRSYPPLIVPASAGYRLDSCRFVAQSANHESDQRCEVAPDGSRATFTYKLRSGPFWDRWRGWLSGRLVTRQSRQQ